MGAVVDPLARRGDPFAGSDCRRMADHRYEVTMRPGFGAKNAEPVLRIVERDTFNDTSQNFLTLGCWLRRHTANRSLVLQRSVSLILGADSVAAIRKTGAVALRAR